MPHLWQEHQTQCQEVDHIKWFFLFVCNTVESHYLRMKSDLEELHATLQAHNHITQQLLHRQNPTLHFTLLSLKHQCGLFSCSFSLFFLSFISFYTRTTVNLVPRFLVIWSNSLSDMHTVVCCWWKTHTHMCSLKKISSISVVPLL